MDWLKDLFSNRFLLTGIASWFLAQVLKTIIHYAVYGKFDFKRLFGTGGMPSAHSATVSSLAIMCGLHFGFASAEFAISTVLAMIVCHDAAGVRRQAGKQAEAINELLRTVETKHETDFLKELLGHTPVQVGTGIFLGIGNALLFYYCIW